ncbi:hypothetical protein [Yinghuangia seranimata]|uniref:hypothetical protein n=1 Tax=Yinghuangia seranimata TaxID=408067 RepID=UPI00248C4870|nr:hypothetical protein [Yinghuangia seranimata]MDI2132490.1 hypothetical protein [Yinghuangia seranimata]
MRARTWHLPITCAAVLLAATGCAVGPTISDEPAKPAAAESGLPTTTQAQTQAPGQPVRPTTPPPGGGNQPGSPGATAAPATSPAAPKYEIGGGTPFVFADGSEVQVLAAHNDGAISGDPKGRVRIAVRLSIKNGTDRPLWAYRLDVQLRACADPAPRCERITTPGTSAEAAKYVQQGETKTVDWFFAAKPDGLGSAVVEVGDPKSVRAEFNGTVS